MEAKGRREVDDGVSLVDVFRVKRGSSRIDIGMEDLLPVRSDVPPRRMVSWQMSEVPLSRWWWGSSAEVRLKDHAAIYLVSMSWPTTPFILSLLRSYSLVLTHRHYFLVP